jgi:hypothetical protein
MEDRKSTGEAALKAVRPTASTPLAVAGMDGARRQRLVAHARSLRVSSFEAPSGPTPFPVVEIIVPVSRAVCDSLELTIQSRCGELTPVTASILTLDWERVTTLRASFERPGSMTMNSVASALGSELRTWVVNPSARRARIEFPCLRPMRFSLSVPGAPIEAECDSGGRPLRLEVAMPRSLAPSLYLDGTRDLALRMKGSRVGTSSEGGIVVAGDNTVQVRRDARVAFLSRSPDLSIDLAVGGGVANRHLEVTGRDLSSVLVGGQELLPSMYEDAEGVWLTVMGTFLGIALAALWGLLESWPGGKRDA